MVFINLELGISHEGDKKLALLQSVFEAIDESMVKFEGESYIHRILWIVKCQEFCALLKLVTIIFCGF